MRATGTLLRLSKDCGLGRRRKAMTSLECCHPPKHSDQDRAESQLSLTGLETLRDSGAGSTRRAIIFAATAIPFAFQWVSSVQ